jgi:hypothetical protein
MFRAKSASVSANRDDDLISLMEELSTIRQLGSRRINAILGTELGDYRSSPDSTLIEELQRRGDNEWTASSSSSGAHPKAMHL